MRHHTHTLAAAALTLALAGCTAILTAAPTPTPTATTTSAAQTLATLNTLPVKGRAPKTGYRRTQFGPTWSDDVTVAGGHNGCDTRNDILNRDLHDTTHKPRTHNCVVLTGTLDDPYTATTIHFTRGTHRALIDIDHIVPISDAWQKGAQQWTPTQRRDFANDPTNLIAVSANTNRQKGDSDAATWLPPNKAYRCTYVTRQVQVKHTYGLSITAAEKEAITRILKHC